MKNLIDWVPNIARDLGKPDVMVHLWCQREAGERNIAWAKIMPAADVDVIETAVRAKYGAA